MIFSFFCGFRKSLNAFYVQPKNLKSSSYELEKNLFLFQLQLKNCNFFFTLCDENKSELFHKSFTRLETLNPGTTHRMKCVRNVRDPKKNATQTSTDSDKCFHETEKKKWKRKRRERNFSKFHQLILDALRACSVVVSSSKADFRRAVCAACKRFGSRVTFIHLRLHENFLSHQVDKRQFKIKVFLETRQLRFRKSFLRMRRNLFNFLRGEDLLQCQDLT